MLMPQYIQAAPGRGAAGKGYNLRVGAMVEPDVGEHEPNVRIGATAGGCDPQKRLRGAQPWAQE